FAQNAYFSAANLIFYVGSVVTLHDTKKPFATRRDVIAIYNRVSHANRAIVTTVDHTIMYSVRAFFAATWCGKRTG
ncbi:hypothetical protein OEZ66_39585, partial [Escherichia coli]|nr:hypothetical protein [Escherichia coli]